MCFVAGVVLYLWFVVRIKKMTLQFVVDIYADLELLRNR